MSKKNFMRPTSTPQSETIENRVMDNFLGMLSGVPASEIKPGYSAKNVNIIDYRSYAEVRPGSKQYTTTKRYYVFTADEATDELTITGHPWATGDPVYFKTSDTLPTGITTDTRYYVIYVDANTIQVAASYADAVAGIDIDITDAGTGIHKAWYGNLNSCIQHDKHDLLIFHYGQDVYVSDLAISGYTRVINQSPTDTLPDETTMMAVFGDEALLATSNGIFRIILDESYYYMYRINDEGPWLRITDVSEDTATDLIYGYWYIYSWSILDGTGNRDRTTGDEILLESATSKLASDERDYGEVFFDTEISDDHTDSHTIEYLEVPGTNVEATHFSVYRTKNIGKYSGGVSATINGIGNRPDFMVWVADVPVVKCFRAADPGGTNNLVTEALDNHPELAEIGCTARILDLTTLALTARTITDIDITTRTITVDGAALNNAKIVGIGQTMRLFRASQVATTVTITEYPAGGGFRSTDVGRRIFWSNGEYSIVTGYTSVTVVTVAVTDTKTNMGGAMMPIDGTRFKRRFNDTIRDDGIGDSVVSLSSRISPDGTSPIYIPRRFFKKMPNGDIIAVDTGYMVICTRGEQEYSYCQYGDKKYHMGYYKELDQKAIISGKISHIIKFPSQFIILCTNKTFSLPLNVSSDVGRNQVGENVYKLRDANVADDHIGVVAWQSIRSKGQNLYIAVTNEPAVRYFDGHSWGQANLAIDQRVFDDAVQKQYIERMDLSQGVIGSYNIMNGYKLWGVRKIQA